MGDSKGLVSHEVGEVWVREGYQRLDIWKESIGQLIHGAMVYISLFHNFSSYLLGDLKKKKLSLRTCIF